MQRVRDELAAALLAAEERAAEAEAAAAPPSPRAQAARAELLKTDAEILLDELDIEREENASECGPPSLGLLGPGCLGALAAVHRPTSSDAPTDGCPCAHGGGCRAAASG